MTKGKSAEQPFEQPRFPKEMWDWLPLASNDAHHRLGPDGGEDLARFLSTTVAALEGADGFLFYGGDEDVEQFEQAVEAAHSAATVVLRLLRRSKTSRDERPLSTPKRKTSGERKRRQPAHIEARSQRPAPKVPAARAPVADDLEAFAARVLLAAHASPTGRWHETKVFISHVWEELRRQGGTGGATYSAFQRELVRAHQAGLLTLSRADLVEAMPHADVKASETAYLEATFHFVRIDGDGRSPLALKGSGGKLPLGERIRAAFLRATGGVLNTYVRLAQLRAELPSEPATSVDAELRRMQQAGIAVLYPIDDPRRLRPEDEAAAIRVSGERRDLLLIRR